MRDKGQEPTAREFMTQQTIRAREDASVLELRELLRREQITCVPVVDEHDRVRGVISVTDLLSPADPGDIVSDFHTSPSMDNFADAHGLLEPPPSLLDRRIFEVMAPRWIAVEPDTALSKVAALLVSKRIHRVLVTEGEHLVGLISVTDVLNAVAGRLPEAACGVP